MQYYFGDQSRLVHRRETWYLDPDTCTVDQIRMVLDNTPTHAWGEQCITREPIEVITQEINRSNYPDRKTINLDAILGMWVSVVVIGLHELEQ